MLGRLPSLFFFFFSFPFLNSSCDLFCVVQLSLTAGAFPSIWGLNYYIYWGWNMQRLSALNFKKAEWFHVPLFVWFRTGSFCGYQGDHHWQEPPFHWRFLLGSLKERKRERDLNANEQMPNFTSKNEHYLERFWHCFDTPATSRF